MICRAYSEFCLLDHWLFKQSNYYFIHIACLYLWLLISFCSSCDRRGAYFVYNHPIFNTAAENHTLLSKIHAIKLRSRNTFDKYVTLKKFKNWHECMTHGCYFWKDFERNMETYKTKCTSLLDFHINVVKHHKANVSRFLIWINNEHERYEVYCLLTWQNVYLLFQCIWRI